MGRLSDTRVLLSSVGKNISRAICQCAPSDPMSGFFLVDRDFLLDVVSRLQSGGFKILVDMLASSRRPVRFAEIGYSFRDRQCGKSKLDVNAQVEYISLVVNKLAGGVLPTRFVLFALVGATGVAIHLVSLALLYRGLRGGFAIAQLGATFLAMTSNFFLNNAITYRDRRLRGARMLLGLGSFWLACSFGAWANVTFARSLLQSGAPWYLAGLAGIILSAVWNFSVSSLLTWQMPKQRKETGALGPVDGSPSGSSTSSMNSGGAAAPASAGTSSQN